MVGIIIVEANYQPEIIPYSNLYLDYKAEDWSCTEINDYLVIGGKLGIENYHGTDLFRIDVIDPDNSLLDSYVVFNDSNFYDPFRKLELPDKRELGPYTINVFFNDELLESKTEWITGVIDLETQCLPSSDQMFNEIKYDVLSPIKFWENVETSFITPEITNNLKNLSPNAFQSLNPEHVDVTSSNFCGALKSSNLTIKEKQNFLNICDSIVLWFKENIRISVNEVDENLAIAEKKIDQLNITDERKNMYKSELHIEANTAKRALIEVSDIHISSSENLLHEYKQYISYHESLGVPAWVKNTAGWWADDSISETQFVNAIEFLIKSEIIHVSVSPSSEDSQGVPAWVKNNAGWWAEGQIDDNSFVQGIEYLVKVGIIQVS